MRSYERVREGRMVGGNDGTCLQIRQRAPGSDGVDQYGSISVSSGKKRCMSWRGPSPKLEGGVQYEYLSLLWSNEYPE